MLSEGPSRGLMIKAVCSAALDQHAYVSPFPTNVEMLETDSISS